MRILDSQVKNPTYISMANPSYDYFKSEYLNKEPYQKGIIVSSDSSLEGKRRFHFYFKSILRGKDVSYKITKGSVAYSYYLSEHGRCLSKDFEENIIVPDDTIKRR